MQKYNLAKHVAASAVFMGPRKVRAYAHPAGAWASIQRKVTRTRTRTHGRMHYACAAILCLAATPVQLRACARACLYAVPAGESMWLPTSDAQKCCMRACLACTLSAACARTPLVRGRSRPQSHWGPGPQGAGRRRPRSRMRGGERQSPAPSVVLASRLDLLLGAQALPGVPRPPHPLAAGRQLGQVPRGRVGERQHRLRGEDRQVVRLAPVLRDPIRVRLLALARREMGSAVTPPIAFR